MITPDQLAAAANAAGIDTPERAQLAFAIVNAFITAGVADVNTAMVFATRAALQLKGIALQAAITNLQQARVASSQQTEAEVQALQQQFNDVQSQLQQTV
jgi:hypothetical protein